MCCLQPLMVTSMAHSKPFMCHFSLPNETGNAVFFIVNHRNKQKKRRPTVETSRKDVSHGKTKSEFVDNTDR